MKGDFSRSLFDPQKHYTSVRMQQGRVQLDADWNEQAEITLHQLRVQLEDLIGKRGIPQSKLGFVISHVTNEQAQLNFQIGEGHCYVDGILCSNEKECKFTTQADYPGAGQGLEPNKAYIVYLDVWEHHVTALEDPAIREVALGGIDTSTRTKTVWQVKVEAVETAGVPRDDESERKNFIDKKRQALIAKKPEMFTVPEWERFIERERLDVIKQEWREHLKNRWQKFFEDKWQEFVKKRADVPKLTAHLAANTFIQQNQLYRVEIHHRDDTQITIKWSRENGSVVYPIVTIDNQDLFEVDSNGSPSSVNDLDNTQLPESINSKLKMYNGVQYTITLGDFDSDRLDLRKGDWVEIAESRDVLNGRTNPLVEVVDVQKDTRKVTVKSQTDLTAINAVLRRWDHREANKQAIFEGAILLPASGKITLENGIIVSISDSKHCKVGDYWLIPARASLNGGMGGIVWPKDKAQKPHGIEHHYAPLAVIQQAEGTWQEYEWKDLRFRTLPALTALVDNLGKRVKISEEHIDGLTIHVEALNNQVENLNNQLDMLESTVEHLNTQLGTLESTVEHLNTQLGTLESTVKSLNMRLQILEKLRRVEWWLVVVIAVLLILFFTPLFFTPQEGRWFVFIILLVSFCLIWWWQNKPPSKGDGAST